MGKIISYKTYLKNLVIKGYNLEIQKQKILPKLEARINKLLEWEDNAVRKEIIDDKEKYKYK
ncbi:regulator of sigma D [Clostridium acetobutylicum]|uniref:Uncharacterized protein n=1 Tax=Clostridium acetobutylicum (strain ATCC 824 / DSM 792 / JCM 1419 / IAM 19013 / LMG 5710 / NBRC 13948 / NRRL B-527 / VKM B-1787 / 2291 / W) TaxID=272562 RepID=Q97JR9_CLOAB|nr:MULTISPECIES: hypothetical protein [Clostridium]AAK79176.1 Hypothetical protein CA_C1204 [Clostridium acetobutylicum ATCC 824]ADZ20254.1 Conserved hypothetical protein [Clostridium acetobutylicum EA 2018]AEI31708.1 hypothetical protein SMB_G1224 [Clostridium acetobutylicum DSM 1731]AWV81573.1 hypothetical protein DK921_16030 [Clostridium acetobutylicum]MBC2393213.1 hypothetical protein [Clostridium acetobutylicum]